MGEAWLQRLKQRFKSTFKSFSLILLALYIILLSLLLTKIFCFFCQNKFSYAILFEIIYCIFIILIFISCGHMSCVSWGRGNCAADEFLLAEWMLRAARWSSYLAAFIFAFLPWFCNNLMYIDHYTYSAILMGMLLHFCLLQSLFRVTFRRFPNRCIALGITLMYEILVALNQQCPPQHSEAVKKFLGEALSEVVLGALSSSIIVTGATIVVKELLTGVWKENKPGAEDRQTWWARLRRTRIHLLLHRMYREHHSISSFNNAGIFFAFALILPAAAIAGGSIVIRSVQEEPLALMPGSETMLWFTLVFGITLCGLGLITHWSCGNASLLQAEYYYICHAGPRLKPLEINQGKPRWRDYCQVFAHVYNSKIDVSSEDRTLHNLKNVIKSTADYLCANNEACKVYFYTELLQNYVETKFKDEQHSDSKSGEGSNGRKREDYTEYPLAVHLARTVPAAFLEGARDTESLNSSSGFCDLLACAKQFYFKPTGTTVWEKCRAMTNLNTEEFQNLVILDVWCDLLRSQPAGGSCALASICNEPCLTCPKKIELNTINDRKAACAAILLVFPLMVASALQRRYGKDRTQSWEADMQRCFVDEAMAYYKKLGEHSSGFINSNSIQKVEMGKILRSFLAYIFQHDFPKYLLDNLGRAMKSVFHDSGVFSPQGNVSRCDPHRDGAEIEKMWRSNGTLFEIEILENYIQWAFDR